ncbi:hypothetical protein MWN34_01140 [Ancylobacter sp. 6x-1]|uniref:Uncharacterized protein n=1 Tax=Ancylobacter crimeensis TaxID=2579147 RepID=A0ABT0D6D8_9HYPH|nr:hypothetical protein [Ancylobacter crimeensis]MCK0195511.1 hypothetical protein [Ancylobacter crimeensis]
MPASQTQGHHSPLVPLFADFDAKLAADDYKGFAAAFAAFVKDNETSRYLALEAVPFKIADHLTTKFGSSSAVTTFTLRRSTWATEVQNALSSGPEAFVKLIDEIEGQVVELTKAAKKPS